MKSMLNWAIPYLCGVASVVIEGSGLSHWWLLPLWMTGGVLQGIVESAMMREARVQGRKEIHELYEELWCDLREGGL